MRGARHAGEKHESDGHPSILDVIEREEHGAVRRDQHEGEGAHPLVVLDGPLRAHVEPGQRRARGGGRKRANWEDDVERTRVRALRAKTTIFDLFTIYLGFVM